MKWVKQKTGPPALDLKTEKELNALKMASTFVVGYFTKLGVRRCARVADFCVHSGAALQG